MYQRSKGDGEAAVRASSLDWTIFQPSVIFGPEDRFLNTFAALAAVRAGAAGGQCRSAFPAVYVGDVADAFVNALDNPRTCRKTYELAGPASTPCASSCSSRRVPPAGRVLSSACLPVLPGPRQY